MDLFNAASECERRLNIPLPNFLGLGMQMVPSRPSLAYCVTQSLNKSGVNSGTPFLLTGKVRRGVVRDYKGQGGDLPSLRLFLPEFCNDGLVLVGELPLYTAKVPERKTIGVRILGIPFETSTSQSQDCLAFLSTNYNTHYKMK